MTTSELIAAAYLKASGKVSSLTATDTKYIKLLAIANGLQETWQDEPDVDWTSLYDGNYSFGTVTATNTFSVPSIVRKISDARGDFVRIQWVDGINHTDYEIVPADAIKRYETDAPVCAQTGSSLIFAHTFTARDAEFGGEIFVPIYTRVSTLVTSGPGVGETVTVQVDVPRWLVIMTAGEFVRNDITKQNQYPNLVQEANELMQRMKDDNDSQVSEPYMPWAPDGADW